MKKVTLVLAVFAAVLSMAFVMPADGTKQIHVVIDAGHGGHDHGAAHDEQLEKQITEAISNKIKAQHTDKNVVLHFTRTTDEFISLPERIKMINSIKPDIVLSLHVNKLQRKEASGMEFYISDKETTHAKSLAAAEALGEKFTTNHDFKIRHIKTAPYMILKQSEVPAITIELGFISNKNDRQYLTDAKEQDRIAATICEFVSELK